MFRSVAVSIASLVAVLAIGVSLFVMLLADVSLMDRYVALVTAAVWACILALLIKADMQLAYRRAFAPVR